MRCATHIRITGTLRTSDCPSTVAMMMTPACATVCSGAIPKFAVRVIASGARPWGEVAVSQGTLLGQVTTSGSASCAAAGAPSAATNEALSRQRADAVRAQLVTAGMPAATISTVGMGPGNPIGDNKTPDGRSQNRRVEVEVTVDESKVPNKG